MTTALSFARLHIALLHWPCLNKGGQIISTATTNLDIHDIARLAKTYAVAGYWIVQPLENQRAMIGRIIRHWLEGAGAALHPNRPDALRAVNAVASLTDIAAQLNQPIWAATTAQPQRSTTSVDEFAAMLQQQNHRDFVLCFGTGWGLAPQVLTAADLLLEPIKPSAYNHLSVRSAVAIYIDRLWCALQRLSS